MRGLLIPLVSMIGLNGCVSQQVQYSVDGVWYKTASEALAVQQGDVDLAQSQITASDETIQGSAIIVLPTQEKLRKLGWVQTGPGTVPRESIDYLTKWMNAEYRAVAEMITKRHLFEDTQIVIGPEGLVIPEATWIIKVNIKSRTEHFWTLEHAKSGKSEVVKIDSTEPTRVAKLLSLSRSIVVAARSISPDSVPGGKTGRGMATTVSCDLRIITVLDGSGIVSANGEGVVGKLDALAKGLALKLKESILIKGDSIAVVSLRNRSGTGQGKVVVDELADKIQGALIDTDWFQVKERIDLRVILREQDLDMAGIVKNPDVRRKLAGVKYVVIGGVTVTEASK